MTTPRLPRARATTDGLVICPRCDRMQVADPPKRIDGRAVCIGCYDLWAASPDGLTHTQVRTAQRALERDAGDYLAWPWPELDRIAGPMAPGQVYIPCAFSGNGKTTFSWSAVGAWTALGIRGYVLPLETRAYEWRTGLACTRLGVSPALALSGRLRIMEQGGSPWAKQTREAIRDELRRQYESEDADTLHVSPAPVVTLTILRAEMRKAAELDCRYILVDHIDHVEPDDYTSAVAESQRVNRALGRLAQEHDLIVLAMSQLNMDISKGDGLSKYDPPQVANLMYPAVKNQVAAGIYGLFRPRDPMADAEAVAAAKRREVEAHTVLKPGCMGVVTMKARHQYADAHEGARCELVVDQGRVRSIVPPAGPAPVRSQHYEAPDEMAAD